MIQSTGWCNRCHHIRNFTANGHCTLCGTFRHSAQVEPNKESGINVRLSHFYIDDTREAFDKALSRWDKRKPKEKKMCHPMQLEIPFKDTINK